MTAPYTLRWGIISTGGIAQTFTKDLLVDPSTRQVADVRHKVVAVGSRSVESAQKFIDKIKADEAESEAFSWGLKNGVLDEAKAYGTYEEVYADPQVEAVYVGTPHTYHYKNTKDALLAGKNVLCEKPFTYNLTELDELIAIAREKNLFLMEAVWTRFHPIAYEIQEVIHSGKLGKVKRLIADLSIDFKPDTLDLSSRLIDPKLGGGALLDLYVLKVSRFGALLTGSGPYPSVWAMLIMHQHPANKSRKAPRLLNSTQTVYKRTNVDAESRWRVEWEDVGRADLVADMTSIGLKDQTVAVHCEEGDLVIEWPPFRPFVYDIIPHPTGHEGQVKERSRHEFPAHVGSGMHYEADEVARCIRDGKVESERMPWDESRIVQGWFDDVRTNGETALKDISNPTA